MTNYLDRRSFLASTASVLGALSLEGTAFGQAQDLKVGFLMPLTGGAGRLGQMMLEGAQLAVEEVNLSGGVVGRKLELLSEDSQALARNGVDGFRKLVDVNSTQIIITGWTTVSLAIAPLASKIKNISPFGKHSVACCTQRVALFPVDVDVRR